MQQQLAELANEHRAQLEEAQKLANERIAMMQEQLERERKETEEKSKALDESRAAGTWQ